MLVGFVFASDFIAKKTIVSFLRTEIFQLFEQWFDKGKIEKAYEDAEPFTAKGIMNSPAIYIGPDESIIEVFEKLAGECIHGILCVEDKRPGGAYLGIGFSETDRKIIRLLPALPS